VVSTPQVEKARRKADDERRRTQLQDLAQVRDVVVTMRREGSTTSRVYKPREKIDLIVM
jgi:hypothetical protein